MKYCINCGKELNKKDNFCTSCGYKIKDRNYSNNIILFLGVALILISSFSLGFSKWNKWGSILKVGFIVIEYFMFLIISILFKLSKKDNAYKIFSFISIFFIPLILTMLSFYDLIDYRFSRGGSLIFIYLSLIYFFTFLLYFLSFRIQNIKTSFVFSYISFNLGSILFLNHFLKLNSSLVIGILFSSYAITFLKNTCKNEFIKKSARVLIDSIMVLLGFIVTPLLITSNNNEIIVSSIMYSFLIFYHIYHEKDAILKIIMSYCLAILFLFSTFRLFEDVGIRIYIFTVLILLIYFLSTIFNDKYNKITAFVISTITIIFSFITLLIINDNVSLLVYSFLTTIYFFIIYILTSNKFVLNIFPLTIFMMTFSFTKIVSNLDYNFILISMSVIFSFIYIVLKQKKINSNKIYKFSAYILLAVQTFMQLNKYNLVIPSIFSSIVWLYYFILSEVYDKSKIISLFIYGLLLVSIVKLLDIMQININNIWLIISITTLVIGILVSKILKNSNYYIYFGIIIIFLSLITEYSQKDYMYILLSLGGFTISYIYLLKNRKTLKYSDVYLLLLAMAGLNFIYTMLKIIIDPIVISSLLSLIIDFVIVVVLYLSDLNNGRRTTILSLIALIPYYALIDNINIDFKINLIILPLIFYSYLLSILISFKEEKNKEYFLFILLALTSFLGLRYKIPSIIFNMILSATFIILGYYKKYKTFIYYGILFLLINILLSFHLLLNNIFLIISLLLIGLVLTILSIVNERKN